MFSSLLGIKYILLVTKVVYEYAIEIQFVLLIYKYTIYLLIAFNFLHLTCVELRHKEFVLSVHTYTNWTLQTSVVKRAEEVTALVQDVDTVVGKVFSQDPTPTVFSDAPWIILIRRLKREDRCF